jgi:uncharacterized membrane protein YdbT with pleckstrin-like domain
MEETTVWKGNSSPVINLSAYALSLLAAIGIIGVAAMTGMILLVGLLVVPVGVGLAKWIQNRCRIYEVTTQRVKITQGIMSKRTDELELYRVKDSTTVEPFLYRLFGAGNIVLTTNDQSTPMVILEAIKNPLPLREELRKNVEVCRDQKRVRIAELE